MAGTGRAAGGSSVGEQTDGHAVGQYLIGGYRLTDLSALVGSILWVGIVLAMGLGLVAFGLVELFVSLAILAFVPLGLGLVPAVTDHDIRRPYRLAVAGQFPAALAAVVSLAVPVGSVASILLALPWVGVAGAVATVGIRRFLARGVRPLPDLAVDVALVYLSVGAIALVLHRAGISLRFDPIIILLTVVHYHYAGFVLPLVAGLAGRRFTDRGRFGTDLAGRVGAVATVVIVVNLALIAVGITFSPLIEVVAVALFTVAVAGLAALVLWRVVPALPPIPGALISVACLSLFLTMALALAYGYSAFPRTGVLVTIGEMIRWHGTLNAFGFALPGLLAFRLLEPAS